MKLFNKKFVLLVVINSLAFLNFNMSVSGFPAYAVLIGSDKLLIGLTTTFSAIAAMLVRPYVGVRIDKIGEKKILCIGLLMLSIPLACIWIMNPIGVLIARMFQGFGWGLASTSCSKLIANSLEGKNIAKGIGVAGMVSSICAAIAPSVAIMLLDYFGPKLMFGIISFSTILALGLSLGYVDSGRISNNVIESQKHYLSKDHRKAAVISAIVMASITFAYAPMVTFMTQFVNLIGVASATWFFSTYAIATILLRPVSGIYIDKKENFIPAVVGTLLTSIGCLALWKCDGKMLLILAGLLVGAGIGISMVSLQTKAVKKVDPPKRGSVISIFLFGYDLGMALGGIIAGIVLRSIDYNNFFGIIGILPLFGLVVLLIERRKKKWA